MHFCGFLAPILLEIGDMKARVLALMLGLVLFDTGCILSPDIEEDVPEANRPPKIIFDSLEPSPTSLVIVGGISCDQQETFTALHVRDPDVDDDLQAGWFIDELAEQPVNGWSNIFRTGNELRNGPAFEINPTDPTYSDGLTHTLTLVVVDRQAEYNAETGLFEFPNDPEGELDTETWSFEISEDCL